MGPYKSKKESERLALSQKKESDAKVVEISNEISIVASIPFYSHILDMKSVNAEN